MRFLLDQHLPSALIAILADLGYEAQHVKHLGLTAASDREIWLTARALGAVMVTKDSDFITLAAGDPTGPKVVRLRLGNCHNRVLFERIRTAWPEVVESLSQPKSRVVDVR